MRKSKFTESQIAGILQEAEAGVAVTEVARKHGISAATFYQWRSKFGGMSVSESPRLSWRLFGLSHTVTATAVLARSR